MTGENPRVVIVDDHELAREGIRLALEKRGFTVVAAAETGEDAIAVVQQHEPDLILLDIRLGAGMDGLAAADAIAKLKLKTQIMMLSLHDDPDYVRAALRAGAKGYVLKDASLEELCAQARVVLSGGTAIPQELLSTILMRSDQKEEEAPPVDKLTERELGVLEQVADGLTNKEIARKLDISPSTVKAHVERVLAKLGAADRTQAAVMMARWKQESG
ncbi:MAG: response regulator transcription factor [Pseudomonadota bacterium]